MKRRLLCLAAFAILAPMPMLAQTTGVLTGKVTDSEGKAVIGATIKIMGTTQGGISKAPDGKFTISNIRSGDYTIRVTAVGYVAQDRQTRISADQTSTLNITVSTQVVQGKEAVIIGGREAVKKERTGTTTTISTEDLDRSARTSIVGAVQLQGGVSSAGVNGFSLRGGRSNETTIQVDGVKISDPFSGGFGNTAASLYPTVSTLAVQEVQVITSSFSAEYGDVLAGVVNSVTKSGRNDRYEGQFKFRTQVGALYGSSDPITVKKAGTEIDTTLPGVKAMSSGSQLYEFAFGGPIPGTSFGGDNNRLTFFLTGKYNPIEYTGASYEVYDLSEEMARQRNPIARSIGQPELTPTNLGQMPNTDAMTRDLNLKLKFSVTDDIFLELSGELGGMRRDLGDWGQRYMLDKPAYLVDTTYVTDEGASYLERDHQTIAQNTKIQRGVLRYNQTLDQESYFEVTGAYIHNTEEIGRKDVSKSYGPFDFWDIYEPVDEGVVDEAGKFLPVSSTVAPNIMRDRYEAPSNFIRNPLTGFLEGAESEGASFNPYGLNDLSFPAHGADRTLEFRESETISFKGHYETIFDLGEVSTRIKTGFDLGFFTLRRHSNSLPWEGLPFFDVYGNNSTYFVGETDGQKIENVVSKPYTPMTGALYVTSTFNYKSIVFQPGVRFDFINPNTKVPPLDRRTLQDMIRAFDTGADASIKFQVSPRIGVTYPVTDKSQFRVSFASIFKMPDFNLMFDNTYGSAIRGNQLFGNPDIDPQKVFMYELGYESEVADGYYLDAAAFYRDIYNQTGVAFVPVLPSPYVIYTVQEYGNVRGLQLGARAQVNSNINVNLNYTLQEARGTASSPDANYSLVTAGGDPFTGEKQKFPLQEFPLSYDQTHNLNVTLGLQWGTDDGPSIGGMHPLANSSITVTGIYSTGLPYTRENTKGEQISEFNSLRLPAVFGSEAHIEKAFPLRDLLGESVGNLEVSLYADVNNILNTTGATTVRFSRAGAGTNFSITADPDNNGTSMDRKVGDFTATPFYRDIDPARLETQAANQYDRFGTRMYNAFADSNLDGVVTQLEKFEGYQRYVATVQTLHGSYQFPRTVAVGFKIRF
jgi:outer membrane receptor protein involved in Fe transport